MIVTLKRVEWMIVHRVIVGQSTDYMESVGQLTFDREKRKLTRRAARLKR